MRIGLVVAALSAKARVFVRLRAGGRGCAECTGTAAVLRGKKHHLGRQGNVEKRPHGALGGERPGVNDGLDGREADATASVGTSRQGRPRTADPRIDRRYRAKGTKRPRLRGAGQPIRGSDAVAAIAGLRLEKRWFIGDSHAPHTFVRTCVGSM